MKTMLKTLILLITLSAYSQNPQPTLIVGMCDGVTEEDVPDYTYFIDLNNEFSNFIGTWKWTNGNEIVIFELTKVTQKYIPEDKIFKDYMIGNYSYSTDGGNSYVVNTITNPVNDNPELNPMYTGCIEDNNKLKFIFNDVVLNKGFCYATFEFLQESVTQMQVKIENPKEIGGRFVGEPEYNYDFTLPTELIVTKQ